VLPRRSRLEDHLDGYFVPTVIVRGQRALIPVRPLQSNQLGVTEPLSQHVSLALNGVLGPGPHRIKVHPTDSRLAKVVYLGGRVRISSLQLPEYAQVIFERENRVVTVLANEEVVLCPVFPLPSSLEPCLVNWIVLVSVLLVLHRADVVEADKGDQSVAFATPNPSTSRKVAYSPSKVAAENPLQPRLGQEAVRASSVPRRTSVASYGDVRGCGGQRGIK
jgi:hypothetical protein